MRLLNTTTLDFEEFLGNQTPPYGILSHVWSDAEVSHEQFVADRKAGGPDFLKQQHTYGYRKIHKLCQTLKTGLPRQLVPRYGNKRRRTEGPTPAQSFAVNDEFFTLDWAWIDTCCIDKRSSAEISEAVNSMFNWYQRAEVCLVFLPDVEPIDIGHDYGGLDQFDDCEPFAKQSFLQSVWFSRGWTLQELLAPRRRVFFNNAFQIIGIAHQLTGSAPLETMLHDRIAEATGIEMRVSFRGLAVQCCNAERMSWASRRQTTRPEDVAYCLLGLFGINMPLLYGEGAARAFVRLQSEIISSSGDDTILAWAHADLDLGEKAAATDTSSFNMLAGSPDAFFRCQEMRTYRDEQRLASSEDQLRRSAYRISQRGLETEVLLPTDFEIDHFEGFWFLLPLQGQTDALRCYVKVFLQAPASGIFADDSLEGSRYGTLYLNPDDEPLVLAESKYIAPKKPAGTVRWPNIRRRRSSMIFAEIGPTNDHLYTPDGRARLKTSLEPRQARAIGRKLVKIHFPLNLECKGTSETWKPLSLDSTSVL